MTQAAVGIRGYNVLSELRHTCAYKSYRVRDLERRELLTLHLFPRQGRRTAESRALLAEQSRYSALSIRQLARLRRIRADENYFVIEVERADGESLESILARGSLMEPDAALNLVEDILVGLVAGEMQGLYHGAVRPSCVVVDAAGRASLDGFGFAALISENGDFYSRLAAEVPVSLDRRHAKDVYAAVALLHHLVEGQPPFDAMEGRDFRSKVQDQRWQGARFREIYDAVAPLERAEAGDALRRIREARRTLTAPPAPESAPSLLDAVDEPPPPPESLEERGLKERWRRVASKPAAPVLAAGAAGALIALVFGAPFLGTDAGRLPSVRSAIALPAAVPLAPAPAPAPEAAPKAKPAEPVRASRRSETESWRQMIIALAEIGDYPAALEELGRSEGRPAELVDEERNAVFAAAKRRFEEIREIARSLTAEQHLAEALNEWDSMKSSWPGEDLVKSADFERQSLVREADALRKSKETRDRLRAEEKLAMRFRKLTRRILREERYDFAAQAREIDEFLAGIVVETESMAVSIGALRECARRRSAFFKKAQAALENRQAPILVAKITGRFGSGGVDGLGEGRIILRRPDNSLDHVPLTRLDGGEKFALFTECRRRNDGGDALAIGLFCLGWGMPDQAAALFLQAESSDDVPAKLMRFVRQFAQEE